MQVHFLGSDGNEVVRVDFEGNRSNIVSLVKLQNKSNASHFKETMKFNNQELLVSPLNLNKERGKTGVSHEPVIRYTMQHERETLHLGGNGSQKELKTFAEKKPVLKSATSKKQLETWPVDNKVLVKPSDEIPMKEDFKDF